MPVGNSLAPLMSATHAEARVFRRAKDAGSQTQKWFSELLKPDPAFQEFVPDVRVVQTTVPAVAADPR